MKQKNIAARSRFNPISGFCNTICRQMGIDTPATAVVHSAMPVFQLTDRIIFPPPHLAEPSGLLAVGGDLSIPRLLAAYQRGIFPWFSEGDPVLWWFTSPRLVLFPAEFHIAKRLNRLIRTTELTCSINQAFPEVIEACGATRKRRGEETWITPEMVTAYTNLHYYGYCHSVECWRDGMLVGGLYGVALGNVFFGESMFATVADSSKLCLVHLVAFLSANGYQLIDCQMTTTHLLRFGAREVSGPEFQRLLQKHIQTTTPDGNWPHGKNDRY